MSRGRRLRQAGRRLRRACPLLIVTGLLTVGLWGPALGAPPAAARRGGDPVEAGLSEARGLLRIGRTEEGIQRLRDLHTQHPEEWRAIDMLGSALEETDRRDDAIALYREAADHLADPARALIRLERLYRVNNDWTRALQVCLEIHGGTGTQGAWVMDEVESLIRSDHVGPEAVKFLEEAGQRSPEDQRLRELLITAYLYGGKAEKALEEALALDQAQKAKGTVLFRFARLAEDKHNPAAALQGYDRILQGSPGPELRDEALFRRAGALRRLGRMEETLQALNQAASTTANPSLAIRARTEIADLSAHELHRPEDALQAYQAVLGDLQSNPRSRDPGKVDEIRLNMAACHLALGRPSEASQLFQVLADSSADTDVKVHALYEVGEMLFYQGKLREAQDAWYRLTDTYPRQRWVNDALERILLVGENSDAGGVPLTALAQAEYQRRLGHVEKGLELVDAALAQYLESRARDDLLRERVVLLLDLGRLPEARAGADTLAVRYPESPLAPRTLLQVADTLNRSPEKGTEAQAIYMEILLQFPESLEAPQARAALQKLKDQGKSSSLLDPGKGPCGEGRA